MSVIAKESIGATIDNLRDEIADTYPDTPRSRQIRLAALDRYAAAVRAEERERTKGLRDALDAVDAQAQKIYDTPMLREGPAGYAGGMRYATRQMRAALAAYDAVTRDERQDAEGGA